MRSLDVEEKVLIAITAAFAVLGLTFACVGIWCFADSSTLLGYANSMYYNHAGVSLFGLQPGWTLVPCGLLGVFPLIFGLVATCKPSRSFLIVYMVYMSILILLELPMSIAMLASWPATTATLQSALEASMNDDYVGVPYSYTHNSPNSLLFDRLMINNQCCGINGIIDFTVGFSTLSSVWYNGYRSHTLGNGTGYTTTIPSACCFYSNRDTMVNNNDWLNYRNYLVNQLCPVDQSSSYSAGCYTTLVTYTYNVISSSIGCYFIVIAMHLAALIVAGLVYHTAHHVSSQPDWTEYTNGRGPKSNGRQAGEGGRGRRGRGRVGENDYGEQMDGPYRGRAVRGNNPNSYGAGWGANNVYGRA